MSEPAIVLQDVDVVYRLPHSRRVSIKEFARDWVGGALSYTEFRALEGVSLSIRKGESVAIVGSNGAGKSTLLKVIAGALSPTRGTCSTMGVLSVVLDSGTCFDRELTGVENIYLAGLLLGRTRAEVAVALPGIIETSDLGEFIDSPMRSYSSGMSARLSFAVSMAWPVDFLLTDESLAVGDASFRERCWNRLRELQRRGQGIIAVSHDADTIGALCDRAIWIDQGRVRAEGPSDDVLAAYRRSTRHGHQVGAHEPAVEPTTQSATDPVADPPVEPAPEAPLLPGPPGPTVERAVPWLFVSEPAALGIWLELLDFRRHAEEFDDEGLAWLSLYCGDSQVMLSRAKGNSASSQRGLYVRAVGIDELRRRFAARGVSVSEVSQRPYKMLEFHAEGPAGVLVTFGEPSEVDG